MYPPLPVLAEFVKELIREPYADIFGAGTVAVQVGKELWVGSFRGDRIARFPVAR